MSDSTANTSRVNQRVTAFLRYVRDRPRLRIVLLVGLPFATLLGFFVFPLLSMISISFLDGLPPASFTLENYTRIVTSDVYYTIFWRTTVITIQTTLIVTVLGYAFAYSIVRFSKRVTVALLLLILPFWTNYIVRMYAWINILQRDGLLDTVLIFVGILNEPTGLLYSHTAVLIGFTYIWLPLSTLAFYASLTDLDPDLIDAAKDLGAGPIKTFFVVTLPLTFNGVIVGVILVAIPTFGAFITPVLLGGTDNVMIGMVIENQFIEAFNWPLGAALGTIVSMVVIAVTVGAVVAGGDVLGRGDSS